MALSEILASIRTHLTSRNLAPTDSFLQSYSPSIKPAAPLIANQKSAESRLLHTDLTTSIQSSARSTFPAGIASPEVQQLQIPGPVPVQVLDIEDIGRSRWSQVETMEMEERGEFKKGQEVIRVVPDDEDNTDTTQTTTAQDGIATGSSGPHKLLLQDAKGNKAYAFELENVDGINVNTAIGAKLMLRAFEVARGVILLTPRNAELLGGKIEAWDKNWREDRKKVLKEKAGWTEGMGMT